MKEFIEKLIGRFRDCTTIEDYGELFVSLDEVENIVNQLAEEYINISTDISTNKSTEQPTWQQQTMNRFERVE